MFFLILIVVIHQVFAAPNPGKVNVSETLTLAQVTTYQDSSNNIWKELSAILVDINYHSDLTSASLSDLYDNSTVIQISGQNCSVPAFSILQNNETAMQSLICCHMKRFRRSVFIKTFILAQSTYAPSWIKTEIPDIDFILRQIKDSQIAERAFFTIKACAQDKRIMIYGSQVLRGLFLSTAANRIRNAYLKFESQTLTLSSCINNPTENTGCISNTTISQPIPQPDNLEYDILYSEVCGNDNLSDFYLKQNSINCA